MATLNEPHGGKAVKGRTKKMAPRVDLTAMVDLMFLLTTFFMLTTSLGTLNAADLAKPIPEAPQSPYPASRTMTIVLGNHSEAACYMGETEKASMKVVTIKNIQKEILNHKLWVLKRHGNNPAKHMIVIIKPTKNSTFKDFVDVIDEMKIAAIKSYVIDDAPITQKEQDFMALKGI